MLPVIWHPKTKTEVSSFSDEVKDKLGYLIYRLQLGEALTLPHSKTMTSVARGAKELRVKGKDGIYRTFYLKVDGEQILVFHAFKKKTQKTAQKDIEQGKKNLKEVMEWLKKK